MKRLVIFDCDGVLVDSERISHTVLQQMLAERGVVLSLDEAVQRFIGTSAAACRARMIELVGPLPVDFDTRLEQRTRQAFKTGLKAVPGVREVLDLLDGLGVVYGVASNGSHAKVNFTLGLTGLLPRLAGRIFTAEDVAQAKPAPDLFLHAARSLGCEPAHVTVVEDTPTGISAAKAAGMRAIGFAAMTPAQRLQAAGADAIAFTMPEIAQLLRR